MTVFSVCALAVCLAGFSLVLRPIAGEFSLLIRVGGTLVFSAIALRALSPTLSYLQSFGDGTTASLLPILCKSLALSFCTEIGADVCRDAGESALAGQIETVGRIELVSMALPFFDALLSLVQGIL